MNVFFRLLCDETAATMVEYAIMLAFIAAVCIGLVVTLGEHTRNNFSTVSSLLADPQ